MSYVSYIVRVTKYLPQLVESPTPNYECLRLSSYISQSKHVATTIKRNPTLPFGKGPLTLNSYSQHTMTILRVTSRHDTDLL